MYCCDVLDSQSETSEEMESGSSVLMKNEDIEEIHSNLKALQEVSIDLDQASFLRLEDAIPMHKSSLSNSRTAKL